MFVKPRGEINSPRLPLKDIMDGEEFHTMQDAFGYIQSNKNDQNGIREALRRITGSIRACFGIDMSFSIVDPKDEYQFYGFNIFPNAKSARIIIDAVFDHNIPEVRNIWQMTTEWHTDVDGKLLYDMSNHLTPREIAILFIYCIEQTVFDYNTPIRICYTIYKHMTKVDFTITHIARSANCRITYIIPLMYACSYVSFNTPSFGKGGENLSQSIITICGIKEVLQSYNAAVHKIIVRYGTEGIVNRDYKDLELQVNYVLDWLYESLNDLQKSSTRMIHNMTLKMQACRSPYIRKIFKMVLTQFIEMGGKMGASMESYGLPITPMMKEMNRKIMDDNWKNVCEHLVAEATTEYDYLDKNGNLKKISRQDIDIVRVECENIETVDDKIYLLEKLYRIGGAIEVSLDMIADPKNNKRVKQTKNELENLKRELDDVRSIILKQPVNVEKTYGLWVKYPKGYEG